MVGLDVEVVGGVLKDREPDVRFAGDLEDALGRRDAGDRQELAGLRANQERSPEGVILETRWIA